MKRDSSHSIIPKIILILGSLSILGIILLFIRSRPTSLIKIQKPESPEKLFTQVMEAARPQILKLWEQSDKFIPKEGVKCPDEIVPVSNVGKSYYQCNPHFWQCFWQGGVKSLPALEIDLFGQTFHVVARPRFASIQALSSAPRFYEMFKRQTQGTNLRYGYIVEMEIEELKGLSQPLLLTDSCRDTYLPQRIYGYGKTKGPTDEGFIWDNFDRNIFLDKFYVSNRQVNEWRILNGTDDKIEKDRKKWPLPALLNFAEQKSYCEFYGKRLLEAKLFDAATMSPPDLKNPLPEKVFRPQTPWQRDLSKSFVGMSRINPDYQLTPLDCQLAQVQGCKETFFTTDSATWMGIYFALGFHAESLMNTIEPDKNLKQSSNKHAPASPWHELGIMGNWNKTQTDNQPVAFRCYEEIPL